jgi:DnaJ-domain-containing protein 1
MNLSGRLRSTTLGDLLGTLHRASATGTLELCEDRGRTHRVHLALGRVVAVEVDGASPSLAEILRADRTVAEDVLRRSFLRAVSSRRLHGQVLVDEFCLSPSVVGSALRRQLLGRLASLEKLTDARVAFRVAVRAPTSAVHDAPLEPREFLHGRRRTRERTSPRPPQVSGSLGAWRLLGLAPGARADDIKRAYRQLARSLHPDAHPTATDTERRALQERFVELTEAYRSLVA